MRTITEWWKLNAMLQGLGSDMLHCWLAFRTGRAANNNINSPCDSHVILGVDHVTVDSP